MQPTIVAEMVVFRPIAAAESDSLSDKRRGEHSIYRWPSSRVSHVACPERAIKPDGLQLASAGEGWGILTRSR